VELQDAFEKVNVSMNRVKPCAMLCIMKTPTASFAHMDAIYLLHRKKKINQKKVDQGYHQEKKEKLHLLGHNLQMLSIYVMSLMSAREDVKALQVFLLQQGMYAIPSS
jgi:hypothetical protein